MLSNTRKSLNKMKHRMTIKLYRIMIVVCLTLPIKCTKMEMMVMMDLYTTIRMLLPPTAISSIMSIYLMNSLKRTVKLIMIQITSRLTLMPGLNNKKHKLNLKFTK